MAPLAGPDRDARLAAVDAALKVGDMPRATALACDALAAGLEHPVFLNLRAHRLESDGPEGKCGVDADAQ